MASLQSLPVELLLHIHLLALSSNLPLVSKHIHSSISTNTSSLYRSNWIHSKLLNEGVTLASSGSRYKKGSKIPQYLSHALRFPICNTSVLSLLEARCLEFIQKQTQSAYTQSMRVVEEAIKVSPPYLPSIPSTPNGRLLSPERVFRSLHPSKVTLRKHLLDNSVELPKRLFRRLLSCPPPSSNSSNTAKDSRHTEAFDEQDLPLLLHILDNLCGNPDSHKGYALAKAVLSRHISLIRLLLTRGADPAVKDSMSVMLATGRNDVQIVKLLVEREVEGQYVESASHLVAANRSNGKKERKRTREALQDSSANSSPGKRRKMEDRIPVSSAMLELAVRQKCEPLIQYFMGKGAVPNLKTLGMLQQ